MARLQIDIPFREISKIPPSQMFFVVIYIRLRRSARHGAFC